jgi:hypothetical protein
MVREIVNANKEKIGGEQGLKILQEGSKILVAKGKKILEFRLSSGKLLGEPSLEGLRKAAIGPSGRLRAPTLRLGKTFLVGFNEELYKSALCSS